MNNTQQNKLNMYVAVRAALHRHQASWNSLTGFAESVDDLDAKLATITSLGQVQAQPNGGRALKDAALVSLVDSAFQISAATRAYAIVNKDAELAAQVDYSASALAKGRSQEVVARCRNIWSTATDNLAVSAAFGITTAKLNVLKQRIDEFEAANPKPRELRTTTRAATKALPDTFAEADEILNGCLDGLMAQFKDSTSEFFNEYFASRRIVDTPSARPKKPAPSPAPVPA